MDWVFTLNSYQSVEPPAHFLDYVEFLGFAEEEGAESGNPHLQGSFHLTQKLTKTELVKSFKPTEWQGVHLERMRGTPKQAYDYYANNPAKPNAVVFEWGKLPEREEKLTYEQRVRIVLERARQGDLAWIEANEPLIFLTYGRRLEELMGRREYPPLPTTCGYWIHGATGDGKSKFIRAKYPGAYLKDPTPFWNGYTDQEVVILEDLDPSLLRSWPTMGYYLKIWADHYQFSAERKHLPSIQIRPKKLIITSNYGIQGIFPDMMLSAPLCRRFKQKRIADLEE